MKCPFKIIYLFIKRYIESKLLPHPSYAFKYLYRMEKNIIYNKNASATLDKKLFNFNNILFRKNIMHKTLISHFYLKKKKN